MPDDPATELVTRIRSRSVLYHAPEADVTPEVLRRLNEAHQAGKKKGKKEF
jgi:hypothetical protein